MVGEQRGQRLVRAPALRRRPVLCLTRLDPTGGADTLLTAFGLLAADRPRLHLDVAGDGPLRGMLHLRAAELGIDDRVHFLGALPRHLVRGAVQRCAALVLPHQDDDGRAGDELRLPILSALDLGRPVVATDRAAPPEVAHLVPSAHVVPPRNATALATALAGVLGPPRRGPAWSCRARYRVVG